MSDDPELDLGDEMDMGPYADAGAADEKQRPDTDRRPGRPKGSGNRKTKDFERWYQAKGFTDPLTAMAQWLTADPVQLQSWFIEHERTVKAVGKKTAQAVPSLFDIIREAHTVAKDLAPYLHGKKPTEVAIIDERLPSLIIDLGSNQLDEGRMIEGRKAMSIGVPPADPVANEINDIDEDET